MTTTQQWSEILFYTEEVLSPYAFYLFMATILVGTGALINLMIAGTTHHPPVMQHEEDTADTSRSEEEASYSCSADASSLPDCRVAMLSSVLLL